MTITYQHVPVRVDSEADLYLTLALLALGTQRQQEQQIKKRAA